MHIDWWTFALQAINVVVLVWLLKRFLFEPVQKAIAARRAEEARRLDDLTRDKAELERERANLAARLGGIEAEGEGIRHAARTEAEAQAEAIVAAARTEAAAQRASAEAAIEREQLEAQEALTRRAGDLAAAMATRLVADLPVAERWRVFLDALLGQIDALTPEERTRLTDGGLTVVTASPLDGAVKSDIAAALSRKLGAGAAPAFEVEAALIGGMELRSRHLVVSNSWRQRLDAMQREVREA